MTKYQVIATPEAQSNIREAFDYIRDRSPLNAARWLRGLHERIESLELFPRRCGTAREQPYFEEELRQLVYKSHRLIFTIDEEEKTVHVVFVRHAARRPKGEPDED